MKKAAIYLRVSTDRQAREGDSIPAQRDALIKYVSDRPDMVLAGEYIDDGISGWPLSLNTIKKGTVLLVPFNPFHKRII